MDTPFMDTPSPQPPQGPASYALRPPPTALSQMHSRYGRCLHHLLAWLFGPIHYPRPCAQAVDALSQNGVVVYITRGASTWLTLCFNFILSRMGLPLAHFVGGVHFFWLQPLKHLWQVWKQRHHTVEGPWQAHTSPQPLTRQEALLAAYTLQAKTAFIALPTLARRHRVHADYNDYIRALITAQRYSLRPVFLVPHVLVAREQSGSAHRSLIDRFFGDRRNPGGLRQITMLLTLRRGIVRMADPINLQTFLKDHPNLDDVILARRLRYELHRRMGEEERVVAGPRLSQYDMMARHVMRDARVRQVIAQINAQTGKRDLELEAQAQDHLRSIAARYNVRYIKVLSRLLDWVFNRIYDGIAVDGVGLNRIIEASRRGPLVFCPSHRSHVDYLVLSFVLWQRGITPPHIAAGINLSFFPLGAIFRGSGAFFLQRSFRTDPLYAAVLRAYVCKLLEEGTSLEFFLEGTRSRSGKLMLPKFGLLAMLVDAWRRGAREDIQFVPVSIDYERIIEADAYKRELQGADKQTENIGRLLRTTRVLRSRYGRVQLQFGDPISLAQLASSQSLNRSLDFQIDVKDDPAWRREVERLGFRILHHVAMVCSVTSTAVVATALLAHPGRGMAQGSLIKRSQDIVAFLAHGAARLSPPLAHPDTLVSTLLEAVQRLVDDGLVVVEQAGRSDLEPIYRVPTRSRVLLDYHKNALMNHFAPTALVARSIQKQKTTQMIYPALHDDTQFLSKLFKKEFIYRVDADFHTYFQDLINTLHTRGLIEIHRPDSPTSPSFLQAVICVQQPEALTHWAGLLDSFVQGYWVTAKTLLDLRAFPLGYKECVTRALERARRAFLEGDITRPEASNRSLIETAIQWFAEAKMVNIQNHGKRQVLDLTHQNAEPNPADRIQKLIHTLEAYL